MLYKEIVTVCSKSHTKHINTLCGQDVRFLKLNLVVKVGVKFILEQATKNRRGSGGITTLSLTSALEVVGSERHAPTALLPGNTRYPLYRNLGGPQDRSGRLRKIPPPHRDSIPRPSSP